jgi:DNA modification methylase
MSQQLLFSSISNLFPNDKQKKRSGTFVDNLKLPVHRWFRYSAGFSAEWVESLLSTLNLAENSIVCDPFAGSGTVLLSADKLRIPSIGIEAHSFVARIARTKMLWPTPVADFIDKVQSIVNTALTLENEDNIYPELIERCFSKAALKHLDKLRRAWLYHKDQSPASELAWLAITSILRPTSSVGTAQWQYILPNKTKKIITGPFEAFKAQAELMQEDMVLFQEKYQCSLASVVQGDARSCPSMLPQSVDVVITSPPYANNYDYADATRFEMSFWGEVKSWGDLHSVIRKDLIVSSAQHASLEKLVLDEILKQEFLKPIRTEITKVCHELAKERLLHGGKKHYHTMIAAYFADMAKNFLELRRVCKPAALLCFVIGDSAPYGIYVPVDRWLGELALAARFRNYRFEKLRDRNIKWKNRKHRVPLHEGRLWIQG